MKNSMFDQKLGASLQGTATNRTEN